ncbi:putative Ig domain-containing protein, partial [Candidatus Poribacteria bacterium]|nr:putative Ig domain-containing protein [Candidatus Poribacteria bacterium]
TVAITLIGDAASVTVTANPASLTADGSSTSAITATVTDINDNPVTNETVTIAVTTGSGSVGDVTNNNDGTYTATYTAGTVVEVVTITAIASNAGLSGTGTITLASPTLDDDDEPIDDPPSITSIGGKSPSESHSVEAGSQISLIVQASDPEGDTITYSASSLPTGATFDASTRTFSWTPTAAQIGAHTVSFTVSASGGSDTESPTINVLEKLTVSITSPAEGEEFFELSVPVSGAITAASSVTINGEAATIVGNTFTGTATFTAFGDQTITVVATASDGREKSASVNITLEQKLIKSVVVTGSPAKVGDIITVTAVTKTPGTASFSIDGVSAATGVVMSETATNTYTGEHTVSAGEDVDNATVTVNFTSDSGKTETDTGQTVTIDTMAEITSIDVSGSPAKAGGTIDVTLTAEAGGTATFSIIGVGDATDVQMTEAPPGTYTGEYKVQTGDNVTDADVTVLFADAVGNAETAETKVTIDTAIPVISAATIDKERVRNGESFEISVTTEANATVSADVSQIDTTQTTVPLEPVDGMYKASVTVSEENTAEDGMKTITVTVTDAVGNAAPPIEIQILLKQLSEFTLHLSKGLNFMSFPLKDERITRLSDFANLIEQDDVLIVFYDTDKAKFSSWFEGASTFSDVEVRGDTAYIVILKEPVSVTFEGVAWDGMTALDKGTNLFAVPVNVPEIKRLSDLAAFIGTEELSTIIFQDKTEGKFKVWTPKDVGTPTDIEVEGGVGYILTMNDAVEELTFVGDAWENTPITAAPPTSRPYLSRTATAVMGITGLVTDAESKALLDRVEISVENENRNFPQDNSAFTRQSTGNGSTVNGGQFTVVLADFIGNNVVKAGDVLSITARYPNETFSEETIRYTVTEEDTRLSRITLPLISLYRLPAKTELLLNYPNPFNPETWIPFKLSQEAHVIVKIYNATGELVRRVDLGQTPAGTYLSKEKAVYWDGKNALNERVASGVYFYSLEAGDFHQTRKMVILK